jgi:hypothetical protein
MTPYAAARASQPTSSVEVAAATAPFLTTPAGRDGVFRVHPSGGTAFDTRTARSISSPLHFWREWMKKNDAVREGSSTRREFTVQAVLALLSGYVITVSDACSSSSTPTQPAPATADVTGSVANNHGHVATVTAVQINTAQQISINIQGMATHNHTIVMSVTDLNNLHSKQTVNVTSSTDNAHSHQVTFTPV